MTGEGDFEAQKGEQKTYYDKVYEQSSAGECGVGGSSIKDWFVHRFLDLTMGTQPASVLEIGCGDGTLTSYLVERGLQVAGVDISSVAIDRMRSRCADLVAQGRVELVCGDVVTYLEESRRTFDAVLGAGIIHHVPPAQWQPFFSGVRKGLKSGGVFACAPEPNASGLYGAIWRMAPFVYEKIYRISYDKDVEKGTLAMKSNDLLASLRASGFNEASVLSYQAIPHFSCGWLARLDRRLVEVVSGRASMYSIVKGVRH